MEATARMSKYGDDFRAEYNLQPRDLTPEEEEEIWGPVRALIVAEYRKTLKTLRFSCADCGLGWISEAEWHEHIDSVHLNPCPHLSWTGDEGPVSELGRMPRRWKCDGCGAIKEDA
jgi:hypothetical protein